MKLYLHALQKHKKWLTITSNLHVGQMVLVAGPGDFSKRGNYKLGRIEEVLPQIRKGVALVRRAKIGVSSIDKDRKSVVTFVARDVSKIAPLEVD